MSVVLFCAAALAGLATAYLLGATPTGYLAGRWLKGIDLREQGSGSTGATNALRTLGPGAFAVVLLVDVLKGAGAVLFALWFYPWLPTVVAAPLPPEVLTPWAVCLSGLAALLGHSRSIWLGFKGGKSVAAGLGVLLAMAWPVGLGGLVVFGLVLAVTRIMSLGSILAAVAAMVLILVLDHPLPYRLFVLGGGLYVVLRHRDNIRRLLAGTEPRVGRTLPGA